VNSWPAWRRLPAEQLLLSFIAVNYPPKSPRGPEAAFLESFTTVLSAYRPNEIQG
jgi:hypothetical protein